MKTSSEAFVTAIGFPRTALDFAEHVLKNVDTEVAADRRHFDLQLVLEPPSRRLNWSVPSWAKPGDIAVFYAVGRMTSYVQEVRRDIAANGIPMDTKSARVRADTTSRFVALLDQAESYASRFAGKFVAIGKVASFPFPGSAPRIRDRLFAPIEDLCCVDPPIPYARLKNTITLRPQATITRLRSDAWIALTTEIGLDCVPRWAAAARIGLDALPTELRGNWRQLTTENSYRCKTEDEFRELVIDPFLQEMSDSDSPVLAECECLGSSRGIVDNVLKIGGQWVLIEVKQRIPEEHYLIEQVRSYLGVRQIAPRRGEHRGQRIELGETGICLVVDGAGFYGVGCDGFSAGSYDAPALSFRDLAKMRTQEIRKALIGLCRL